MSTVPTDSNELASSDSTKPDDAIEPKVSMKKPKDRRGSLRVANVLKINQTHGFRGCWISFLDRVAVMRNKEVPHTGLRKIPYRLERSNTFQLLMAVIIIGHICLGVHETDLRAEKSATPSWMTTCEATILTTYLFEIILRLIAHRVAFFLEPWNYFDVFVVSCDASLLLLHHFSLSSSAPSSFSHFSLLRSVRLLRVFNVLKHFLIFREVYMMIQAVFSAVRTLVFGGIIAFAIMTSLSLLAVEILDPLAKQLAEEGVYDNCERCHRAFSSVIASNLTFMKTIVAGDGWGELNVPLMEHFPEAALLLTFVFLTLQMGLVNIIIAVIVDRVSEARVNDATLRKTIKEEALQKSYRQLWKVFKSMDEDENGTLSVEEMRDAYKYNVEFKFLMKSMDFSSDNIDLFFDILDKDHSGEVTYEEFVEQLHMMREFDGHTMLVIIRHLVESLHEHIDDKFDQRMKRQITSQTDRSDQRNSRPSLESNQVAHMDQKDTLRLYEEVTENADRPKLRLCTQVLEHIDTLEDNLLTFAKVMKSLVEKSHEDLVSAKGASASDRQESSPTKQSVCSASSHGTETSGWRSHERLAKKVLQRTRNGLAEGSELRQIRNSIRHYLSYLVSWDHMEETTFQVEALEEVQRLVSRKVLETAKQDTYPLGPPPTAHVTKMS